MRNLAAFFPVLLLLSCAGPPQAGRLNSQRPVDCWLSEPAIYRMRQSAMLEYQGKKEILEGFMELDLNRDRAHLVIFSTLGLTLLNIEVEPHHHRITDPATQPQDELKPNRRKQQFAAAVATAVQNIFFRLENDRENYYDHNLQPLAEFSGTPLRLTKISENRQKPTWSVTYHDYHKGQAGWLPDSIILQNHKPDYRLTLWLHKTELMKEVVRE